MSDKYTLTIQNDSTQTGDFCIFQEAPDINIPNIVTLAWLSKTAHPTTRLIFDWTVSYNFVWATNTDLAPGTQVNTSQSWDANLQTLNRVDFDYLDGAYTFSNPRQGDYAGNLYIDQQQRVQSNGASVGIGMSGKGAFMVPSQPNMNIVMTPKPTYWVVFGSFSEGEVLDIGKVSESAYKVVFRGTNNMQLTYTANNTWQLG
ncbi:MAG: protein rhiA [Pseudomonadota bacterium]